MEYTRRKRSGKGTQKLKGGMDWGWGSWFSPKPAQPAQPNRSQLVPVQQRREMAQKSLVNASEALRRPTIGNMKAAYNRVEKAHVAKLETNVVPSSQKLRAARNDRCERVVMNFTVQSSMSRGQSFYTVTGVQIDDRAKLFCRLYVLYIYREKYKRFPNHAEANDVLQLRRLSMVLFSHFDFSKLNQQDRNPVNTFALYAYSIDEIRKTSVAYTRTFACINTVLKQLVGRLDSLEAYEDMLVQPNEDLMRNPSFILLGKTNSIYVQKLILLTRELFSHEFLTGEDGQFVLCQELITRKDELLTDTLPNYFTEILRKVTPAAQHFFHFYGIIYTMNESPLKDIVNQYFFKAARKAWSFIKNSGTELLAYLYTYCTNILAGDFDTLYKLTTDRVFYNESEQVNMLDIVNDFLSQISLMHIEESQHERVRGVTDERFPDQEFPEVFDSLTRSTREEIIADTQLYKYIYDEVVKKSTELNLDTEIDIKLLKLLVDFLEGSNGAPTPSPAPSPAPTVEGLRKRINTFTMMLNLVNPPEKLEILERFKEYLTRVNDPGVKPEMLENINSKLDDIEDEIFGTPAPGNALRLEKEALMRRINRRIKEINKKNPRNKDKLLEQLAHYKAEVNDTRVTDQTLNIINGYINDMKAELAVPPPPPPPGNVLRLEKEALELRIDTLIAQITTKKSTNSDELVERLKQSKITVNRPEATDKNLQAINKYLAEIEAELARTPGNAPPTKDALRARIADMIARIKLKYPEGSLNTFEKRQGSGVIFDLQQLIAKLHDPASETKGINDLFTAIEATWEAAQAALLPRPPPTRSPAAEGKEEEGKEGEEIAVIPALPPPPDGLTESDRRLLNNFKIRITSLNKYYDEHQDSTRDVGAIQALLAGILQEIEHDPLDALANYRDNMLYVTRLENISPGIQYDESTGTHSGGGRRTRKKRSYKKRSYRKRTYKRRR
jgi:hypothetical protein